MDDLDIETFEMIAIEKGCDIAFPLKEKFLIDAVSQICSQFNSEEGTLSFGGGTSLVCAYDELTRRFSEDADFRFYPRPKSTKKIRESLTSLISGLNGFSLVDAPRSDSNKIEFHLEDNANVIRQHTSLRPFIKIEVFFAEMPIYNPVVRPIRSIYRKFRGERPESEVSCVAIEETAIDKLCSFLWRVYANETLQSRYHPSDMRHLNDLFYLSRHITIDEKFKVAFLTMCNRDFQDRLRIDTSMEEVKKLVFDALETNRNYADDFERYVANMSYANNSVRLYYDAVVNEFHSLIKRLELA